MALQRQWPRPREIGRNMAVREDSKNATWSSYKRERKD